MGLAPAGPLADGPRTGDLRGGVVVRGVDILGRPVVEGTVVDLTGGLVVEVVVLTVVVVGVEGVEGAGGAEGAEGAEGAGGAEGAATFRMGGLATSS